MKNAKETLIALLLATTSGSHADEAKAAKAAKRSEYAAPWTKWSPPPYRHFVLNYVKSELAKAKTTEDRDKLAETILMSSADTYERYRAAKETGFGVRALLDEAIAGVESDFGDLVGKKYFLRSTWEYYAYDEKIQGFPMYGHQAKAVAFDYANPEVKYGEYVKFDNNAYMQAAIGRGMSLVAPGFQLGLTKLSLDLSGWAIPTTRGKASDIVRSLLKSGSKRTIGIIAVYTLSRCHKVDADLKCYGKIEAAYAYADGHSIRADAPPLFELVWHDGNVN